MLDGLTGYRIATMDCNIDDWYSDRLVKRHDRQTTELIQPEHAINDLQRARDKSSLVTLSTQLGLLFGSRL